MNLCILLFARLTRCQMFGVNLAVVLFIKTDLEAIMMPRDHQGRMFEILERTRTEIVKEIFNQKGPKI